MVSIKQINELLNTNYEKINLFEVAFYKRAEMIYRVDM